MKNENKKIVIVGAGMAGLTAGAYLSKEKYDVLIIDKNNRTGGLVSTFEKDGFSFDSGPRAFVNSGMVKPMLKDLDLYKDIEILKNDISITIKDKSTKIDDLDKIYEYRDILIDLYPEYKDDIEKIMNIIYKLSLHTKVLYEFDNPNFINIKGDFKFIFKKLIPWSFKFLNSLRNFNKYSMPMEEFLNSITDNKSLIDILTQFFFKKTPTYFALGYFYVYLDYFYPKGGTGKLPEILHQKILSDGGKIKLNTEIDKVIPSQNKIIDLNGNEYFYDELIWAADLKTLYKITDTSGLANDAQINFNIQKEKILSAKAAESVFINYIAVNRPPSFFKENGGAHMFFTPSKMGLGETNETIKNDLINNFEKKSKEDILNWVSQFLELNTFEVSVPSLRDPNLSPEGKTGIMISCLFDYELYRKISEKGWDNDFRKEMEDKIIHIFSDTVYKGFKDDIIFNISTTPLSINKITGNSQGAIVGWSFETKSPVANKLKDIPKSADTPIPNVYQASQWAYAPAGVPIAMLTGWTAYQNIIKKANKKNKR